MELTTGSLRGQIFRREVESRRQRGSQTSASLNEPTRVGLAGNWKIQLILTRYSGTLNFRVQITT